MESLEHQSSSPFLMYASLALNYCEWHSHGPRPFLSPAPPGSSRCSSESYRRLMRERQESTHRSRTRVVTRIRLIHESDFFFLIVHKGRPDLAGSSSLAFSRGRRLRPAAVFGCRRIDRWSGIRFARCWLKFCVFYLGEHAYT